MLRLALLAVGAALLLAPAALAQPSVAEPRYCDKVLSELFGYCTNACIEAQRLTGLQGPCPEAAALPAVPGARVCDPVLSGLVGYCTTACDQVRRATGLGGVCPTT